MNALDPIVDFIRNKKIAQNLFNIFSFNLKALRVWNFSFNLSSTRKDTDSGSVNNSPPKPVSILLKSYFPVNSGLRFPTNAWMPSR